METLEGIAHTKPFPHLIIKNFYNEDELKLIWEELNFYTRPGKFLDAKYFGGVIGKTNSHALALDSVYREEYRHLSNILTVNRKLFDTEVVKTFSEIDDCCSIALTSNWDITKVRYYHDNEYYEPHIDNDFQFLAFSYFYKEPKKFIGGEIIFPKYDYQLTCKNNSIILFPGWVEHAVNEVKIENSDYYDGWGRYSITSFFGNKG